MEAQFFNVWIVSLWTIVVFTMLDLWNLFCRACLGNVGLDPGGVLDKV